ncbi:MAG: hypothetical protein GX596_08285, partial [Propionibacterium sp.]|nr:hypothetical protein [Propionibacterium sp.]
MLAAVGAILASVAFASPPAAADLGVSEFSAPMLDEQGLEVTQAGARPFEVRNVIGIDPDPLLPFSVSASLKDVVVDMPVGFVGDPSEFPACTVGSLTSATCPNAAQIGVFLLTTPFQTFAPEPVYNMEVPQGQPARFGVRVVGGSANVFFDASVRPSDNGITVTSSNIAHIELAMVLGTELRLWGVPGDPAHDALRAGPAGTDPIPFLTTQTNCDTVPVTRMRARSWQDPDTWIEREHVSPPLVGCELLEFEPSVRVEPQVAQAGSPSGYTVEVSQKVEDSPDALATAHLKDAVVKLPAGVTVNPAAAGGLTGCTEAEMGMGKAGAPAC